MNSLLLAISYIIVVAATANSLELPQPASFNGVGPGRSLRGKLLPRDRFPDPGFTPGGLSPGMDVTEQLRQDIQEMSQVIKSSLADLVLKNNPNRIPEQFIENFRNSMTLLRVIPLTYKTQMVAGTLNYVRVGFGNQCFTVKMLESLPPRKLSIEDVMGPVSCVDQNYLF